ncbi:MAG: hypothetical protein LBR70_03555 [Lactobacillaceae bacterium]|jgi:SOS-response transcriptional repressor LexA|nr:hypothetical protein [Lactobacillaceae bacterium]
MTNGIRRIDISKNEEDAKNFSKFNSSLQGEDNYLATHMYETQGSQVYIYSKERKTHSDDNELLAYIVKGDDFLCFKMQEKEHIASLSPSTYITSVGLEGGDTYKSKSDMRNDGDTLSRAASVLKENNPRYYEVFNKYIPGSWAEIEGQIKSDEKATADTIQKKKMEEFLGRF